MKRAAIIPASLLGMATLIVVGIAWARPDLIPRRLGSSVLKCEAVGFLGIWPCCLPSLSFWFGPRRSLGRHPDRLPRPRRTDTVASVTIEVDLPPGVEI